MRGRSRALSPEQRLTVDLLRFTRGVPVITDRRDMKLGGLIAARAQCTVRPRWIAIFAKAYALVARDMPQLRLAYLPFPWPHFYEYPTSVAMMLVGRVHESQTFHFNFTIRDPAALPLSEIDRRITHAVEQPPDQVPEFRRAIAFARLPTPLRRCLMWLGYNIGRQRPKYFGTFWLTTLTDRRASALLVVGTTRLSYARFTGDGTIDVRVGVDHRAIDGVTPERVLKRLEEVLTGPIVDELRERSGR
jgi:hypothetical protein